MTNIYSVKFAMWARNNIEELLEVLEAIVAYEDNRPAPGTYGAEIYAKAVDIIFKVRAEQP